jgi:hypothetical protein
MKTIKKRNQNMKLSRSQIAYRHAQIIDFCLLIKSFFPKYIQATIPEEYHQEKQHIETLEESSQQILKMLIQHLTILNQHYRVQTQSNRIETTGEDIYTALYITGEMLQPERFMNKYQYHHYKQLQMTFKTREFTSIESRRTLLVSKTQTTRILQFLRSKELLEVTRIEKGNTHYYRLK